MDFSVTEDIISYMEKTHSNNDKKISIDNNSIFNNNENSSNKPPIFLSQEEYNTNIKILKKKVKYLGLPENIVTNISYDEYVRLYKDSLDKYK